MIPNTLLIISNIVKIMGFCLFLARQLPVVQGLLVHGLLIHEDF
jgi:hypothetical protein